MIVMMMRGNWYFRHCARLYTFNSTSCGPGSREWVYSDILFIPGLNRRLTLYFCFKTFKLNSTSQNIDRYKLHTIRCLIKIRGSLVLLLSSRWVWPSVWLRPHSVATPILFLPVSLSITITLSPHFIMTRVPLTGSICLLLTHTPCFCVWSDSQFILT